jgi:hypothetical protein
MWVKEHVALGCVFDRLVVRAVSSCEGSAGSERRWSGEPSQAPRRRGWRSGWPSPWRRRLSRKEGHISTSTEHLSLINLGQRRSLSSSCATEYILPISCTTIDRYLLLCVKPIRHYDRSETGPRKSVLDPGRIPTARLTDSTSKSRYRPNC